MTLTVAVTGLWGPLAVQVASGSPGEEGAASYGFHGEYVDAERGLVDLGQRWYDPRHQVFFSADPAQLDDPANLVGDPRLSSSYTLNHANSWRFVDPDGRMPGRQRSNSAPAALGPSWTPRSPGGSFLPRAASATCRADPGRLRGS